MMEFIYGKQDFKTLERGEENCYLMTNGLGGYSALTMAGSCSRNDHAVLMSCDARESPNHRYNMIHRLEEVLALGEKEFPLSSQRFTDRVEAGIHCLTCFSFQDYPQWTYMAEGVEITKKLFLMPGENTVGISYEIENCSDQEAVLKVKPYLEFVPKGARLERSQSFEATGLDKKPGEERKICRKAESVSKAGGPAAAGRGTEMPKVGDPAAAGRGTGTSEWTALPKFRGGVIKSGGRSLYCRTDGEFVILPMEYHDDLYYAYDACDGRAGSGAAAVNHGLLFRAAPGERLIYSAVYGTEPVSLSVGQIEAALVQKRRKLTERAGLQDATAETLVMAAHQFISCRASTGQQTILAGFPFFEDWGRDTMIALTGCCLSTGQFETAESILKTFMMYCRKGLMPNLFPEGKQEPRYNTADAALLFILAVYEYYVRTKNKSFLTEAYPVMKDIVSNYVSGTDFCIRMEEDGLISAGQGYDQVTWMDVRVGDILPTPRHGKPVEINAYWYNALRMMDYFKEICKAVSLSDKRDYKKMAETAGESFREKFWNAEKKCLRDVISPSAAGRADAAEGGKYAAAAEGSAHGAAEKDRAARGGYGQPRSDDQIRCNQIWAVALPFSLLDREQEKMVVRTVFQKLYTPLGLRTLEQEDPEFKPFYGGELLQRDLAYHQGTVWVFPLGAYYLAYLKVNDYSEAAQAKVRRQLRATTTALREGCIGQLPEIYDGLEPISSKGCFAQAWSVGEMLRVYEALEKRKVD